MFSWTLEDGFFGSQRSEVKLAVTSSKYFFDLKNPRDMSDRVKLMRLGHLVSKRSEVNFTVTS